MNTSKNIVHSDLPSADQGRSMMVNGNTVFCGGYGPFNMLSSKPPEQQQNLFPILENSPPHNSQANAQLEQLKPFQTSMVINQTAPWLQSNVATAPQTFWNGPLQATTLAPNTIFIQATPSDGSPGIFIQRAAAHAMQATQSQQQVSIAGITNNMQHKQQQQQALYQEQHHKSQSQGATLTTLNIKNQAPLDQNKAKMLSKGRQANSRKRTGAFNQIKTDSLPKQRMQVVPSTGMK